MLEYLKHLDQELLLYLNSKHSPLWDEIMLKATDRLFWIPFYVLSGLFLVWKFRKQSVLVLITLAVLVIIADQFSSALMKPLFERLRPCYNESITDALRIINGCGGKYGFISSHAANTFAFATFMVLLFKKQYKLIYAMYLWAFLVSYSRIYLGVHYPGDIMAGASAGIVFAILFFRLYEILLFRFFYKKK